jgi:hypothetical protein
MPAAEFTFNIWIDVTELFGWQKHEYKVAEIISI